MELLDFGNSIFLFYLIIDKKEMIWMHKFGFYATISFLCTPEKNNHN
jgi:hypothetical protein